MTRWEGETNQSMYERCSMGACASGVKRGLVEWVKRNTLRWFRHIERMNSEEFVKEVYVSEIEDPSRRGRPLRKCKDKVKEDMSERGATRGGGLQQAKIGRGGGSSAMGARHQIIYPSSIDVLSAFFFLLAAL